MKKGQSVKNKQVIILHGNDEQGIDDILRAQVFSLPSADPATAELNTVQLDAQKTTLSELQSAALSMPFLSEKKLIVLRNALILAKGKQQQTALQEALESLPSYIVLALIILDDGKNRKNKQGQWAFTWDTLNEKHWLSKWQSEHDDTSALITCTLPTQDSLPQWLMEKAKEKGGKLSSAAAYALSQAVGTDTRTLNLELDKMLLYVNYEREINDEDVHLLTSQQQHTNVFDMIDALSNRKYNVAYRLLHQILSDEDGIRVFGMITRQFRLLLQANELLSEGARDTDIARELKQHPFVARKLSQQARNFKFEQLKGLYNQLQAYDADIKIGKIQASVAMEIFISQLSVV
ncbi:MAG: DNA polymerase III subunit delta [Anaerolineaceae bacterium]|nr:DNA polymerase III subunit delta [Anaerolineaceae bacterium]